MNFCSFLSKCRECLCIIRKQRLKLYYSFLVLQWKSYRDGQFPGCHKVHPVTIILTAVFCVNLDQPVSLWFSSCPLFQMRTSGNNVPSVPWCCWLSGRKVIQPVKTELRYWCDDLSATRCKWFAYGPAGATAIALSLPPVKSRMVYLCGAGLPRLSWKKGRWNGCSRSSRRTCGNKWHGFLWSIWSSCHPVKALNEIQTTDVSPDLILSSSATRLLKKVRLLPLCRLWDT